MVLRQRLAFAPVFANINSTTNPRLVYPILDAINGKYIDVFLTDTNGTPKNENILVSVLMFDTLYFHTRPDT